MNRATWLMLSLVTVAACSAGGNAGAPHPGNTAGSQFCGCNNAFCVPRCANAPGSKRSS